ncbi:MAG: tetratricopeptide repeat protein [Candidatus Omnitrophica bacterium]|nr:tetratricopeptide repeat protein [Candidatus Omnitrophota bacterium]
MILSALVWGKTVGHSFVWDDEYFIVSNNAIHSWTSIPGYFTDISTSAGKGYAHAFGVFRPIRNISYLVDFKISHLDPRWCHLHNLILHLLNALLVFLIAKELLKEKFSSLFAGLVYLIHPAQSEVVAWVKCRDDLLAGLFVFTAFLLWLRWHRALNIRQMIILAALYFLACLSKEQAIALPAAFLLYDILICGGNPFKRLWRLYLYLFLAGLTYLAWRHCFIGHTAQSVYLDGGFLPAMMTMFKVGVKYLLILAYPQRLLADYSGILPLKSFIDWHLWLYAGILALFAALVFKSRKRWPVGSFGLCWIVIFLLPVSNLVPMKQYMAERFLYLPIAGFAVAMGAGLLFFRKHTSKIAAASVAIFILTGYGVRSEHRVNVWRNDYTLFAATVQDTPAYAVRPRINLLTVMLNNGEFEKALPIAREIFNMIKDDPSFNARDKAQSAGDLGLALLRTNNTELAKKELLSAIKIDPSYVTPYIYLGFIEGKTGDHPSAIRWFKAAVRVCPEDPSAYYNLGVALKEAGRPEEAKEALKNSIACGYPGPEAHETLAALDNK